MIRTDRIDHVFVPDAGPDGCGFLAYSNEVTVTTLQALPAAPTNLQATAISSSQVNMTWTNNAPDATAIRVEYLLRVPQRSQTLVRQQPSPAQRL